MSDERYELKGKIGQGGVGAVYRAFDNNLNREVAIKRVLPGGGYESDEEATKAMLHEATSLCSVQHPHIVTVFDAGVDSDGPYVVMELLSGRTLDEMVERGTLTYEDFREVALQSQEALIAAQDLNLVHRDIKPTNMMVTWLPSGRFQVKLVDFGLAKFSPQPSLQTIDHGDSVFGSIYFMAPEQFERTPLDQRTDMYSLGCVYYYCLTGQHPFDGETAPMVMTAHLQNRVTPLVDLRPDLPKWLCDWVMWHIARDLNDRPPNAREALKQFLMAETEGGVAAQIPVIEPGTNGTSPNIPAGPGPAQPALGHTAPQPILPPEGQQPSVHTAAQQVRSARLQTGPAPIQQAALHPGTGPVSVSGAAIPSPVVGGTGPVSVAAGQNANGPLLGSLSSSLSQGVQIPDQQKGLSNSAKAVIGAALAVLLGIAIAYLVGTSDEKANTERLNQIVEPFQNESNPPQEVLIDGSDLKLLLNYLAVNQTTKKNERQTLFQALRVSTAKDATDIDQTIAEYALNTPMSEDVRQNLFRVVQLRAQPSSMPALLTYLSNSKNESSSKAALRAVEKVMEPEDFTRILNVVQSTSKASIKVAVIDALIKLVKRSNDRDRYINPVKDAYESATQPGAREGLLRLMGAIGGIETAEVVREALSSDSTSTQIAAIGAMRNWPDTSMFDSLYTYVDEVQDPTLRAEGFRALLTFVQDKSDIMDDTDMESYWEQLVSLAYNEKEQLSVIAALEKVLSEWVEPMLDYFIDEGESDRVIDKAERAKRSLLDRLRR